MKPFYKSKAMWGVIVLAATFLAQMLGVDTGESAGFVEQVKAFLDEHGMVLGSALGVWGIRTADTKVGMTGGTP